MVLASAEFSQKYSLKLNLMVTSCNVSCGGSKCSFHEQVCTYNDK